MDSTILRPVVDEILQLDEGGAHLLGSACQDCGTLYFPPVLSCRNPDCAGKTIVPSQLGGAGVLFSFTIQRYRPPALFALDPWEAYAIGSVDLAGGVRVLGIIQAPFDHLRPGLAVRLSTSVLNDGDEGAVITHVFVPDEDAPV
ncbi:Zn-ribbon domain-containing OB-fold protein [Brevundimonas aurifodinae]|uniref:OB-fold domain-containing protein n=2 Tax=Brevundimonas TaxID=41275 RepID=A0ABV1NKJ5_9CAUL|nr:MAG: hypothetical protein B7Z42_12920 [Brevundimonas sp. 12-68-7]OYX31115.1 MAG: hypothetical protein B7Z01_13125 [Brevundimonas subvibrioides]